MLRERGVLQDWDAWELEDRSGRLKGMAGMDDVLIADPLIH